MPPAEDLLTTTDVARMARVDSQTVRRWIKLGARGHRLAVVHVGGKRFVTKAALQEFFTATQPAGEAR